MSLTSTSANPGILLNTKDTLVHPYILRKNFNYKQCKKSTSKLGGKMQNHVFL